MAKYLTTALAAVWLAFSVVPPVLAEEKKITPQQQKMKDCAGKWQDEKKAKNVKGRAAYRTFMSSCLKG